MLELAWISIMLVQEPIPPFSKPTAKIMTLELDLKISRYASKYSLPKQLTFQIQPIGYQTDDAKKSVRFSRNTHDCVGTFSAGSLTGIIVALVLGSVFIFGFLMLTSVQTMDRFDDPKVKQLVINSRE
jgi:hypothetical protein